MKKLILLLLISCLAPLAPCRVVFGKGTRAGCAMDRGAEPGSFVLSVSPSALFQSVGQPVASSATMVYTNGLSQDVTRASGIVWTLSSPSIATASSFGVVTPVANRPTPITA